AKDGPSLAFDVCYCGSPADGERVLAPLRGLGKPVSDKLGPAPYVKLQGAADPVKPFPFAGYFQAPIAPPPTPPPPPPPPPAPLDYIESPPAPFGFAFLGFQPLGSAANRVAPSATAFWNRHARYDMVLASFWKVPGEGAERNTEWTRAAWTKLEPFTEGYYVN